MRMCKAHWDAIRERIKELGLWHLVAKSGEEAHAQMVADLQGQKTEKDYDPLMSCHWMITNHAIEKGGIQLLMNKPDGTEPCPICEAWEHRNDGLLAGEPHVAEKEFTEYWINGPTNAALEHARKLGLVPVQQ